MLEKSFGLFYHLKHSKNQKDERYTYKWCTYRNGIKKCRDISQLKHNIILIIIDVKISKDMKLLMMKLEHA